MNRKSKLFFSLVSLCFSIAVLCFGVYSAMSVSYTVSGSVSYTVKDVFVSWTTRVYRMTSTTPLGATSTVAEENQANVSAIQALGAGDSVGSGYEQLTGEGYTHSDETYDIENGIVTSPGETYTPSFAVPSLTYGSPTGNETQGYAFYIVIDITNYGSEIVNAVVSMNNESTTSTNTDYRYTNGINIPATADGTYGTGRLVIGLALSDVTVSESGNFGFTITINRGSATFGYDNVWFSTATTAVVESVNVDGASTTYDTPVTFANAKAISLNSKTIGAKEEKIVKITLKAENSSSAYQRLRLTYSNLPEGLRVNSTSIFLPQDGTEKVYTIKFYNQTSEEISLENVQATISLENVSNLLMHDTINDYYYVEMGTVMRDTENEYIRWRLIGTQTAEATEDTASQYTRFSGTTAPTSGTTGVFVLETDTLLPRTDGSSCSLNQVSFNNKYAYSQADSTYKHTEEGWEDIDANYYATSTVRRYINGTDVYKGATYISGSDGDYKYVENTNYDYSNMYTDFCIDTENDEVYKAITGRTLNDLYLDGAGSSSGGKVTYPTFTSNSIADTTVDKFWLLSYKEANALLSDLEWPSSDSWFYILRSPGMDADTAYYVGTNIADSTDADLYVNTDFYAARAAFILSL